jgi:primosomal protein N' (replication factor Y)
VQTWRPEDPSILRACALDVEGFFTAELRQRKILGFPPYTRLIRFTIRSKDPRRAEESINRLAGIAEPLLPRDANTLGPAPCPITTIAGSHRWQLLLRCPSMGPLHAAVRTIIDQYGEQKDRQVYLEVDVDPVSLL